MTRIEIKAGDRHVIVDHDGELPVLEDAATRLMGVAERVGARPSGPATGFSTERRWTPPAQPSSMHAAPRPYPIQVSHPDDAGCTLRSGATLNLSDKP